MRQKNISQRRPYTMGRMQRWLSNGLCCLAFLGAPSLAYAQSGKQQNIIPEGRFVVTKTNEQMSLVINSSKILQLQNDVLKTVIHNESIVQIQPMSRNELMISSKATGVTQVDLYGQDDEVHSVQVVVLGDSRELEAILKAEFPTSSIVVRPIPNAVILSGQVTSDLHLETITQIAEKYYPDVINNVGVVGMHTIMLHTQVLEVSRTKLQQLGIDWNAGFGNDFVGQSVSGVISSGGGTANTVTSTGADTFKVGIVNDGNSFFSFIQALRTNNLVKVMADPTVVAIDGRPASFNSGGEFPILVPAGLGQVGVEFREFGTRLDFVAKVRADGRIALEVRPTISEIDPTRNVTLAGVSVPGIRSRFVDTAVELRAGQTLALAGLLQMRTEVQSVGLPGLSEIPYLGAIFRSNREIQNEVELLITVTPDFAGPMEAHEVPMGGPGFNSSSPTSNELFFKGYMEVPGNCPDPGMNMQPGMNCPPGYGAPQNYGPQNYGPQGIPLGANGPGNPQMRNQRVNVPSNLPPIVPGQNVTNQPVQGQYVPMQAARPGQPGAVQR